MAPIDPGLFSNPEVYLRVWFSDGVNGFQQLSPDQRVASVGYALMGGTVPDGSVSQQKLSPDLANTIAGFSTRLQQLEALASRLQELSSVIGLAIASSENPQDSDLIGRGYQPFYSLGGEQWTAQWIPNSPAPRTGHSTLWTGSEMLLWGGHLGNGVYAQSGGGYDPAADRCTTTAGFATPSPRQSHTAIWTGNEMIVWGGFGAEGYLNTGARYTPDTNRWRPVSSDSAPESSGTETNQGHQASSFGFSKRASSPSNRSPFTIALQIEGNFGFSFRCRFS